MKRRNRGKVPPNPIPFRAKVIGGPEQEGPQEASVNPYQLIQNMSNAMGRATAAALDMGVGMEKLIAGAQEYLERMRQKIAKVEADYQDVQKAIAENEGRAPE